ncbi:MAG TPA: alpha/beta family hydrolase [Streptosporangiales bacterium]
MSDEVEETVETSVGTAGLALDVPDSPAALLVIGHGAGGGVNARDILAVRRTAVAAGYAVARTTQPYRLAGRRAPAPARHLDAAFTELVVALRDRPGLGGVPVVTGGRSSGARVACRTADAVRADGVLALSFPLHPPGRPDRSRADELLGVRVPVLVVQGERDTFGSPDEVLAARPGGNVELYRAPGADHGMSVRKGDPPVLSEVAAQVVAWVGGIRGGS